MMNDGDVTAPAGALSYQKTGSLDIATGSREAEGFMDKKGRFLGWLNELAFAPVEHISKAPADEWSGDTGVGTLYFSLQTANKPLASASLPKLTKKSAS